MEIAVTGQIDRVGLQASPYRALARSAPNPGTPIPVAFLQDAGANVNAFLVSQATEILVQVHAPMARSFGNR